MNMKCIQSSPVTYMNLTHCTHECGILAQLHRDVLHVVYEPGLHACPNYEDKFMKSVASLLISPNCSQAIRAIM